ncbi:MAG: tRNA lysidine(34) synthetase TilS [Planctomycetota bacterium]
MTEIPPGVVDSWRRLAPETGRIVIACSGGPDSMALLLTATQVFGRERPHVVTVDHRTRPDSAPDAEFVLAEATAAGVSAEIVTPDRPPGDLSEAAARDLRYAALAAAADSVSASAIATGHQADDQVETILFRILRGTGLDGLAGIPERRPHKTATGAVEVIRPLLGTPRDALAAYVTACGRTYRLDPTNDTADYRRNRLRNEALPLLRDIIGPGVDTALRRLGGLAAEEAANVEAELVEIHARLRDDADTSKAPGEVVWPISVLAGLPEPRVRALLISVWNEQSWPRQGMTRAAWTAAAEVARGERTALDLPGGVHVRQRRGLLRLTGPVGPTNASSSVDSGPAADYAPPD